MSGSSFSDRLLYERVGLLQAKRDLAKNLRSLNRVKEANALEPNRNVELDYEFMLNDEEKAALQKEKKAGSAK